MSIEELHEVAAVERDALQRRNELILELRLNGYTWPVIAEASGLTLNACERIAQRMNGGVTPVPVQSRKLNRPK